MSKTRSSLICKLICAIFVLITLLMSEAVVDAQTCTEVSNALIPCATYMATRSSFGHCCSGIRLLNSKAKTTSNRRQVCNCLTRLAVRFRSRHRLDFNLVQRLPGMCKVNIRYSITTLNPKCDQVN